jgi:hypothetical protein
VRVRKLEPKHSYSQRNDFGHYHLQYILRWNSHHLRRNDGAPRLISTYLTNITNSHVLKSITFDFAATGSVLDLANGISLNCTFSAENGSNCKSGLYHDYQASIFS